LTIIIKNIKHLRIAIMECKCGRSPTGKCIGWHGLSDEEYKKRLKEYQAKNEK
jgi:hypothetical protein